MECPDDGPQALDRRTLGEAERQRKTLPADVQGAYLAVDGVEGSGGNEPFLGFRLVDLGESDADLGNDVAVPPDTKFDTLFPPDGNKSVGIDLVTDLYFTFMYPSGAGQIRYANDRSRTIALNVFGLKLMDFAHPTADFANNRRDVWNSKKDRKEEARMRVEQRVGL